MNYFLAPIVLLCLAACAQPNATEQAPNAADPYEGLNRSTYNVNLAVDKAIVRPVAVGYSAFVPDDIETMIGRFADNTSLPGSAINSMLRGDAVSAGQDLGRFVVNTTIGLGGFFDPASELQMPAASDTDFGEVLYTWGYRDSAYFVRPLLGPSSVRDTIGFVVDTVMDPLGFVIPSPESYAITGANVSARLSDRGRYADTIDSILYGSADGYAQARLLYQQNRSYELGKGSGDDYIDPYGDTAAQAPASAVSDLYEDPYDG